MPTRSQRFSQTARFYFHCVDTAEMKLPPQVMLNEVAKPRKAAVQEVDLAARNPSIVAQFLPRTIPTLAPPFRFHGDRARPVAPALLRRCSAPPTSSTSRRRRASASRAPSSTATPSRARGATSSPSSPACPWVRPSCRRPCRVPASSSRRSQPVLRDKPVFLWALLYSLWAL